MIRRLTHVVSALHADGAQLLQRRLARVPAVEAGHEDAVGQRLPSLWRLQLRDGTARKRAQQRASSAG